MGSSSQRKGGIKVERAKHLRPFGRRQHWKRVRALKEHKKPARARTKRKPWIIQRCYRFLDFDFTINDRYATERDMRNALRTMDGKEIAYAGHRDLL